MSIFNSKKWSDFCNVLMLYLYSGWLSSKFLNFGPGSCILPKVRMIVGGKYIIIGSNCILGKQIQITAYDHYGFQKFSPIIDIGNGTSIGDYSHITAINKIIIGDNVLTGRNVLITDNSHGGGADMSLQLKKPPVERPLQSKGPVVIGDNVWLCEKVTVTGGVTIGEGCIIGANVVVTKDVPPYTLVVGNPARYINIIQ